VKDSLANIKTIALHLDDNDRRIIQSVAQRTGIKAGVTVLRYILREYARMTGLDNNPSGESKP